MGVQTAASMPDESRTSAVFQPSQGDKRTAFYTARKNGLSIVQASKVAGVHRDTGSRWEAEAKVRLAEQAARGVSIATKAQVAAELTRLGLEQPDVAPRDKVNALTAVSKVMGYDAPTRTEQVIVHASVAQWIEAQRQAAMGAGSEQRTIEAGGTPPIEARAESVSPSPNISNSEKK